MNSVWVRLLGVGVVAFGAYSIWKRSVDVGIEGREPAFVVKGDGAIVLGIVALSLGLLMIAFASAIGDLLG